MTVVTLEVKKDAFVRTHAQERANDFYGQHLAVVQRRLRTALTKFQVPSLKPIVNISKQIINSNYCSRTVIIFDSVSQFSSKENHYKEKLTMDC